MEGNAPSFPGSDVPPAIRRVFKKMLADHGTAIIKLLLYILEQLELFQTAPRGSASAVENQRSDYKEREFWDKYIQAYEDMLEKCSTKHAPWYVIPSNHKWFRNLAVSHIIADTLDDLDMKMPSPQADIKDIRRKYHTAAEEQAVLSGKVRK